MIKLNTVRQASLSSVARVFECRIFWKTSVGFISDRVKTSVKLDREARLFLKAYL
jgi:hypothetical protein